MRKKRFFAACTAVLFVLYFTQIGIGAENPPIPDKAAEVNIGSHGIYWQPGMNYTRITLTVDCPGGQVFHKTFAAGTNPYFSLSDLEGQAKDGSYTYELIVCPVMEKRTRKADDTALAGLEDDRTTGREALIQTGYFTVKGGAIVIPGIRENGPARPLDIVHSDDVIIDGSLCVGFDCYTDYDFGFNTIVLMENNLRILFDDTSSSSSYPDNDWRIIINDSTDGGDWINGSSRAYKENIRDLTAREAVYALKDLKPVMFNYKFDKEEKKLGFIAEDVPELVAQKDRKGMSPMDVVAVLTRVLQEQQKTVEEQQKIIAELQKKVAALEKK